MVEGDLVDLTLPTLLQALTKEHSTAMLRLQHGPDQGALYFCEGALVHAASGEVVGDEAVLELLGWSDGRFRISRDADRQPRTITQRVTEFLTSGDESHATHISSSNGHGDGNGDEQLLTELLTLLARLEQDRVRLEGQVEAGGVPALLVVTTIVNSLVAFVTARCTDSDILPSRVLPRLADTQPYTQLLGEDNERISIATAASVLKTWNTGPEDRQRLFQDLCRALLDILTIYCNTVNTFFHSSREREEWRATFDVFVDGLWTAVKQIEA
ncbi:MAG: DUF4388 domain-containing protein [Vicinamibacterales bacterium]